MVFTIAESEAPSPAVGKIKICKAIFVYVTGGNHWCALNLSEAGLLCNVAKRAVAKIAPEKNFFVRSDEQIDVAAVVEVGWHDCARGHLVREFCGGGLVGECFVAVVA